MYISYYGVVHLIRFSGKKYFIKEKFFELWEFWRIIQKNWATSEYIERL